MGHYVVVRESGKVEPSLLCLLLQRSLLQDQGGWGKLQNYCLKAIDRSLPCYHGHGR
jgi:hypothetical protein